MGGIATREVRTTLTNRTPIVAIFALVGWTCLSQDAAAQDFDIPIHRGNGLANVFAKLNSGQTAKIAFIGGSITEGAGYRDGVTSWFNSRYPGKVTSINAGWSGTGSLIGAMRYARDVLVHDPDLIFIEFAVNDLPEDPISFIEQNYDGMVRQAWQNDPMADILIVETMAWYLEGAYLSGNLPNTVQAHYNVADHYGVSSVNMGWALYEAVLAGTPWENLAPDRVHPNAAGSQIYTNAVTAYLDSERTRGGASLAHNLPTPLTAFPVTGSTIHAFASVSPLPGGWVVHTNEFGAPSFVQANAAGPQITLNFTGPVAAVKMVMGPDDGTFSYSIDGGPFVGAGLIDAGHFFLWAIPVAKTLSNVSHSITFRTDSPIVRLVNVESATTSGTGPAPGDSNLALTAVADAADTIYGAGFDAAKARDGSTATKWTSLDTSSTHWLAYDLGALAEVSTFIVKHAGAGGEWAEYNTQSFTIESGQGLNGPWTTEFTGSNPNQLNTSAFSYGSPRTMRYVRLRITDAGIDNYARIPEFEVWGVIPPPRGDMDLDGDVDLTDYGLFQACFTGPVLNQNDPDCSGALLDGDTHVDVLDLVIFKACMSGADVPAPNDCGY